MAGLLDALQSDSGLLGLYLMAAGSAKPQRTSLGEGLLGGVQMMQQQQEKRRQQAMQEEDRKQRGLLQGLQMDEMRAQIAQRTAAQQAAQAAASRRGGFLDSINPNSGPAMPFNPAAALQAGLRPEEMKALAPGEQESPFGKVNPGDYTPESVAEFAATRDFTRLRKPDAKPSLNDLIVMGPDGKPMLNQLLLDAKRKIASAGASNISQSYGAPVAGIGPDGNPLFFQPAKGGGTPSIIPGVAPPKADKALTEAQAKATVFQSQMAAAEAELKKVERDPSKLTAQADIALAGSPLNILASQPAQQARQAQEQWAESFLRFKTGAASTEEEVKRNVKTFFPQQGDKPDVIAQKARMRAQAQQDIAIAAGSKPPTGQASGSATTVVRTGKDAQGRKVQQMSDGSIRYAD